MNEIQSNDNKKKKFRINIVDNKSKNNNNVIKNIRKSIESETSKDIMKQKEHMKRKHKSKILSDRTDSRIEQYKHKITRKNKILQKMKCSPFHVDLLAETERIEEENKVRLKELSRKESCKEQKRNNVKNAILVRALEEANELDALRKEKRKILEEERRLKALMEIEKSRLKHDRRDNRMAAEIAVKQRRVAKSKFRQNLNKELIDDHKFVEKELLKIKHEIDDEDDRFRL